MTRCRRLWTWLRPTGRGRMRGLVVSCLKAIFASATMSGNLLAIHSESVAGQSASTRLNGATFVDATVRLGDRGDRLTAVAMHSATEAALRKLDLIDFVPDSEGKAQIRTFQGRRVVVDDNLPTRAGSTDGTVYTTYLFGPGAFAKGAAPLSGAPGAGGIGTEGVEFYRDALASDSDLINRRRYILHPRGVKFNSASVAGDSPTNAELETAANWTRVFEKQKRADGGGDAQQLNGRSRGPLGSPAPIRPGEIQLWVKRFRAALRRFGAASRFSIRLSRTLPPLWRLV